ncbi:hypothetical protein KAS79_03350 [Candidatus Parcubacteria bacterium]|nr:hypothetical protein [Candidatus Parcubacteria bacterium]
MLNSKNEKMNDRKIIRYSRKRSDGDIIYTTLTIINRKVVDVVVSIVRYCQGRRMKASVKLVDNNPTSSLVSLIRETGQVVLSPGMSGTEDPLKDIFREIGLDEFEKNLEDFAPFI